MTKTSTWIDSKPDKNGKCRMTRDLIMSLSVLCSAGSVWAGNDISSVGMPRGVATFECIGVTLNFSGDDNRNASCGIEYAVKGTNEWKEGHPLFVDHRMNSKWGINSRQFRGSIVHLKPGTTYKIRLRYEDRDGGSGTKPLEAATWSESFPEGDVSDIADRSTTLTINESGTATAYRVYRGAKGQTTTLDCGNQRDHCVVVNANYVIIRGFRLHGSRKDALIINPDCHHVVIENCDISDWGPSGIGRIDNWDWWKGGSAIHCESNNANIVVQHCRIHYPRGGSNSWNKGSEPWNTGDHPKGPQGICFNQSLGNHVIRYNHVFSSDDKMHYFNDPIGGGSNGDEGNCKQDTDIYGNIISHFFDDGIEVEGLNINVRIWGNVIHTGFKAIATANIGYNTSHGIDNSLGPQYVWRNLVYNMFGDHEGKPNNCATKIRGDGGFYFYHNTILNAYRGLNAPGDPKSPEVIRFGVVKNNIIACCVPIERDYGEGADKWDFDYNMYTQPSSDIKRPDRWEKHGIFGATPSFTIAADGYTRYLKSDCRGIDAGGRIANFNDAYTGMKPDIGACEKGAWAMRVGPRAD